jgi:hypothetical protein
MDSNALIFLSYASPDLERVRDYYNYLIAEGFEPWFDKQRLVAGQNWDLELKRALGRAAVIVVFLSKNSIQRRGYLRREVRIALDQAQTRLVDDIYVIPVMLDEVEVPMELQDIQVVMWNDENPFDALKRAVQTQLEKLGAENERMQGDEKLRWNKTRHSEKWEGLPGYEIAYHVPHFSSQQYPHASEITTVLKGWLASEAMDWRETKFSQDVELFDFGQEPYFRMNTWEADFAAPSIKGQVVSISYSIWWMGARAAHPNSHFSTFAFTLSPLTKIKSLETLFEDPKEALRTISRISRKKLLYENERIGNYVLYYAA